jgi:hypothetical protein
MTVVITEKPLGSQQGLSSVETERGRDKGYQAASILC